MSKNHHYEVFDVFTATRFEGNPLAIVHGADDLTVTEMQKIAGEFNLSETIFVRAPEAEGHAARVRIFTPKHELDFAGHPTVGCSIALTQKHYGAVDRATGASLILGENLGPVRCHVTIAPDSAYAEFIMPALPEEQPLKVTPEDAAGLVNLAYHQIGFENHDISSFAVGPSFLMIPVFGLEACGRAKAQLELSYPDAPHKSAYIYTRDTVHPDADFHVRLFAPAAGIPEDPATGSAAAAFAGVIMKYDRLGDGLHHYTVEQGVEMGRPSLIYIKMKVEGGALIDLMIGGYAVKVSEGTLFA